MAAVELDQIDIAPDEIRALKAIREAEILGGRPSSEVPLARSLLERGLVTFDDMGRLKPTLRGRRVLRHRESETA